jgi:hypothetical protein
MAFAATLILIVLDVICGCFKASDALVELHASEQCACV